MTQEQRDELLRQIEYFESCVGYAEMVLHSGDPDDPDMTFKKARQVYVDDARENLIGFITNGCQVRLGA